MQPRSVEIAPSLRGADALDQARIRIDLHGAFEDAVVIGYRSFNAKHRELHLQRGST